MIRADVHQLADVAAALADRIALEPFADLIKQHDGDGLRIIPVVRDGQGDGTDGRDRHQKALIEHLPVAYALERLDQDIITDHQIGDHVQKKPDRPFRRHEMQHDHERGRNEYARQHLLLLFVHHLILLSVIHLSFYQLNMYLIDNLTIPVSGRNCKRCAGALSVRALFVSKRIISSML